MDTGLLTFGLGHGWGYESFGIHVLFSDKAMMDCS